MYKLFFSVHFLTGTLRTANLTFGGHSLTTYKSNMNGLSMHRKSLILEFLAHYFIANFCLGIFGTLFHSISLRILVIIFRLYGLISTALPTFVLYIGKFLSAALIFTSTNPQYNKRFFIELPVQCMKIPSSEHVAYTNCFLFLL